MPYYDTKHPESRMMQVVNADTGKIEGFARAIDTDEGWIEEYVRQGERFIIEDEQGNEVDPAQPMRPGETRCIRTVRRYGRFIIQFIPQGKSEIADGTL